MSFRGLLAISALTAMLAFGASPTIGEDPPKSRTFHVPERGEFEAFAAIRMRAEGFKPKSIDDFLALRRRLVSRDYDKSAFEAKAFLAAMERKEMEREGPAPPEGSSPFARLEVAFDSDRFSALTRSRFGNLHVIATPHADLEWRDITRADAVLGQGRQIRHAGGGESSTLRQDVAYWFGRSKFCMETEWTLIGELPDGNLYRSERSDPRPLAFYVLADTKRDSILAAAWTAGAKETVQNLWLFAGELPDDPKQPFVVPRIALNFEPEWTEKGKLFWAVSAAYVEDAQFSRDPDAGRFAALLRDGDLYIARSGGRTIGSRTIRDVGAGFNLALMTPDEVIAVLDDPAN